MDQKDKRLIDKSDSHEQQTYLNSVKNKIEDASDKFEKIEIEHEPIGLIERISSKHAGETEDTPEPAQTDDDD